MKQIAKKTLATVAISWVFGISVYYVLLLLNGIVLFFPGPHYMYHEVFVEQYLLIVALSYGGAWAVTTKFRNSKKMLVKGAGILLCLLLTYIVASSFCGVLYFFHDMLAGFFPSFERAISILVGGASTGLVAAVILLYFSMPFSLISIIYAIVFAAVGEKLLDYVATKMKGNGSRKTSSNKKELPRV